MPPWIAKFAHALHGIRLGIVGQNSFAVHLPAATIVLALAGLLGCDLNQWCLLLLCIALVLSLELINSAVEHMARGLCNEHNENVGQALDIASAAVLMSSLFAATIGLLILGNQALTRFF